MSKKELGKLIRKYREERKLSEETLGKKLGVSGSRISQIENGDVKRISHIEDQIVILAEFFSDIVPKNNFETKETREKILSNLRKALSQDKFNITEEGIKEHLITTLSFFKSFEHLQDHITEYFLHLFEDKNDKGLDRLLGYHKSYEFAKQDTDNEAYIIQRFFHIYQDENNIFRADKSCPHPLDDYEYKLGTVKKMGHNVLIDIKESNGIELIRILINDSTEKANLIAGIELELNSGKQPMSRLIVLEKTLPPSKEDINTLKIYSKEDIKKQNPLILSLLEADDNILFAKNKITVKINQALKSKKKNI